MYRKPDKEVAIRRPEAEVVDRRPDAEVVDRRPEAELAARQLLPGHPVPVTPSSGPVTVNWHFLAAPMKLITHSENVSRNPSYYFLLCKPPVSTRC